MQFNSILFLCLFLPIFFMIYNLGPAILRKPLLVLAGFLFYSRGNLFFLLLLAGQIVFNYLAGIQLMRVRKGIFDDARLPFFLQKELFSKILLGTGILANVFIYVLLSFSHPFSANLSAFSKSVTSPAGEIFPVGKLFFLLFSISYLTDVYRNRKEAERHILDLALYLTFFPKLIGGPAVRYENFSISGRKLSMGKRGMALFRILIGLSKKVLLADGLLTAFFILLQESERSFLTSWLGIFYFGLGFTLDLSALSDMAIGLSELLGYSIRPNFRSPLRAGSLADFWNRWNISLKDYFLEYVYLPLGGSSGRIDRQILSLAFSWIMAGLLLTLGVNGLFFGIWNSLWILAERYASQSFRQKLPAVLRKGRILLAFFPGMIFLFSSGIKEAGQYFSGLIGFGGGGLIDRMGLFSLKENLILLILTIFFSLPYSKRLFRHYFLQSKKDRTTPAVLLCIALLLLSMAGIISGNTTPFLAGFF